MQLKILLDEGMCSVCGHLLCSCEGREEGAAGACHTCADLPAIFFFLLVMAGRCWLPPLSLKSAEPISESGSSVFLFSIWQQAAIGAVR